MAPATALFGRAMKTKLPKFNEGQQEPTLEANDRNAKMKIKNYADAKTYVRPSTIKKGDTVFVRRDDSKRKRDTPYRPEPYVVISKNGSMVTASNKSGTVTRNSSYFKKAPTENVGEETSDDEDIDSPVCQPEAENVPSDMAHSCSGEDKNIKNIYHSLYSILDFDWLIHLQITACKYRSAANNWCKYFIEHAHFENASSASIK